MDLDNKNTVPPAGPGQQPNAAGGAPAPKSSNKLVMIIVAAVVGVSILGAVGNFIMGKVVSFGARKALEVGTGIKIDEKGGKVSFQGKDGAEFQVSGDESGGTVTFKDEKGQAGVFEAQTGDGAKTPPKDFPADFPIMTGSDLTTTWSMSQPGQGQNFNLVWSTKKSPADVAAFYEGALAGQGWSKTVSSSFEETTLTNFERAAGAEGKKDNAMITISVNEGVTEFTLTLTLAPR